MSNKHYILDRGVHKSNYILNLPGFLKITQIYVKICGDFFLLWFMIDLLRAICH